MNKKQQKAIERMWFEGYQAGFLEDDPDELKALLKEDGRFKNCLDEAVDYYFSLCA